MFPDIRIETQRAGDHVGEFSHHLDAGKPAAGHDEGEQPAFQVLIVGNVGILEALHHVVAQTERIRQVPHRHAVFRKSRRARKVRCLPQRHHELVVVPDYRLPLGALEQFDRLRLKVDFAHRSQPNRRLRQHEPQRRYGVERVDGSRGDFRQ